MKHENKFLIGGAIIFITILIFLVAKSGKQSTQYDNFAKCLTEKGVKMYGAYWCPHCAAEKKRFGGSFQYVTYVECSLPNAAGQNDLCNRAGIKGYPTFEFADGSRVPSELELVDLSEKTGCPLIP